jgi:hypothetical protein
VAEFVELKSGRNADPREPEAALSPRWTRPQTASWPWCSGNFAWSLGAQAIIWSVLGLGFGLRSDAIFAEARVGRLQTAY